jgi:drug/metabolite transporter (DMT)-like permease
MVMSTGTMRLIRAWWRGWESFVGASGGTGEELVGGFPNREAALPQGTNSAPGFTPDRVYFRGLRDGLPTRARPTAAAGLNPKAMLVMIAFAAIYVIWGTTYLAIGVTVQSVPPVFMVVLRGAIAGGVLYVWARMRGAEPIRWSEIAGTAPTAALLFGGGYVLVGWAEQSVPSGPAALLNATTPAWVVVIEWLTRRRGRPNGRVLAGLAAGVVGVLVLVRARSDSSQALALMPALALIAASAAWAGGTVLAGKRSQGDPLRGAALQLLTGALLLLPVSVMRGEASTLLSVAPSTDSLLALSYLVVFGSLIGYSAYAWLLHQVPASKVASHSYVNPLVAVLVGALLAGERVTGSTLVAGALIIVSVVFIITEKSKLSAAALAGAGVDSSLNPRRSEVTPQLTRLSHESSPVRRGERAHDQRERRSGAAAGAVRNTA